MREQRLKEEREKEAAERTFHARQMPVGEANPNPHPDPNPSPNLTLTLALTLTLTLTLTLALTLTLTLTRRGVEAGAERQACDGRRALPPPL